MTENNASVTDATYRVYGYDANAHWRELVRSGRAIKLSAGSDEHGEYALVRLLRAGDMFTGERR